MSRTVSLQFLHNTKKLVVMGKNSAKLIQILGADCNDGSLSFVVNADELMSAIMCQLTPPAPHRMESFMYLGSGAEVAS